MAAGPAPQAERTAFRLATVLVLCYVALRAVLVPVTHDEAMTFFIYVETGSFLPFLSHWDAGNHVLCTALAWASYKTFGFHLWALRLPSVLAFLLYATYAWKWGARIQARTVRLCWWAALLLLPFVLDFFSLFRGYGPALALWSMTLYELCAFVEERRTMRLVRSLAALFLAVACALSLATAWAFVLVLVLGIILRMPDTRVRMRQLGLWALLGVLPLAGTGLYLRALAERGTLYYGTKAGLLAGTVPSLLHALLGTTSWVAVASVVVLFAIVLFAAIQALRRKDRSFGAVALVVTIILLVADLLTREALFRWNGTLYPEDRTALQWVLLFLLAFVLAIDRWAKLVPSLRWAACALLVLPVHTLLTAGFSTTRYWPEEAVPDNLFRAAAEVQRASDRPLTLGAYHQMPPCWAFGARERGLHLDPADASDFPQGRTDLLLLDPQRMVPPAGYHTIAEASSGRARLLARDHPLPATLVLDTLLSSSTTDAEFQELWHPRMEHVRGGSYLVELELAISADQEPLPMDLVCEVDADGAGRHYESMLLQFMGGAWHGDTLHVVRRIPQVAPDARKVVVYFWDIGRRPYAYVGHVRIWRIDP